jgi:hypothetical protein
VRGGKDEVRGRAVVIAPVFIYRAGCRRQLCKISSAIFSFSSDGKCFFFLSFGCSRPAIAYANISSAGAS